MSSWRPCLPNGSPRDGFAYVPGVASGTSFGSRRFSRVLEQDPGLLAPLPAPSQMTGAKGFLFSLLTLVGRASSPSLHILHLGGTGALLVSSSSSTPPKEEARAEARAFSIQPRWAGLFIQPDADAEPAKRRIPTRSTQPAEIYLPLPALRGEDRGERLRFLLALTHSDRRDTKKLFSRTTKPGRGIPGDLQSRTRLLYAKKRTPRWSGGVSRGLFTVLGSNGCRESTGSASPSQRVICDQIVQRRRRVATRPPRPRTAMPAGAGTL